MSEHLINLIVPFSPAELPEHPTKAEDANNAAETQAIDFFIFIYFSTPFVLKSFLFTINNSISTIININVDNALIDGFIPFLAIE